MVCLLWVLVCVWFVFCWFGCLLAGVGFLTAQLEELAVVWKAGSRLYEAPPERHTIHFIFADPILVAMECVPVSSSNDLKQDVRSCVRSVKIQKLYETFVC